MILTSWDLLKNFISWVTLERKITRHKYIKQHTDSPDITLAIIHSKKYFWCHVVRGTYNCIGILASCLQYFWNSEIANLDCVITSKKNVLSLNVSMNHSSTMDILKSKTNLHKPVKDFNFTECFIFSQFAFYMIG